MASSCIVDRFGQPFGSANTLYKTPSQNPGDFRRVAAPRSKTYEAVSAWQRREMVDVSRVIAAGVTNIDTALIQAGEFSVGDSWHIKSKSANRAWGKRRDAWFNQVFAKDCNLRGRMNDWRSSLRQLNWTRKVEGDYAIVFDGQPYRDSTGKQHDPTGKFSVIKYDRISSGLNGAVTVGNGLEAVKEIGRASYATNFPNAWGGWVGMYIINDPASAFDGMRLIDGVIVDANLQVLGYRITGFNDVGVPIYCDVAKERVQVNFSARKQVDMIRGIPEIAEAILPVMGLDDIQYLITMAVKLASAMAVTRESADGRPSAGGVQYSTVDSDVPSADGESTTTKKILQGVQEVFPGIVELAVNNKESLKTLGFDRPSMNEERFIERIETSVLHKLWPRDLIYTAGAGRAGARAIGIQARTICSWDQCCLSRDADWISHQATAYAMAAGFIPGNDNLLDPYNSVFTVPGQFTVDEGNDLKMRLQALGRCVISRGIISEMDGYLAEEIEEQREAEVDRILTSAERLAAKHTDFGVKEIALMLDNAGMNMSFADAEEPAPEEEAPPNEGVD